jgi:hypothetical protein
LFRNGNFGVGKLADGKSGSVESLFFAESRVHVLGGSLGLFFVGDLSLQSGTGMDQRRGCHLLAVGKRVVVFDDLDCPLYVDVDRGVWADEAVVVQELTRVAACRVHEDC